MNGDMINDIIYKRNSDVQDMYNFKLEMNTGDGWAADYSKLKNSVLAGSRDYDLCFLLPFAARANIVIDGLMYNMLEVPHLRFDEAWWHRNVNDLFTFDGYLPFVSSDMLLSSYQYANALIFNKKIADDYGLNDIYDVVRSGKWTLDKFGELCRIVAGDENGDGVMDENDRYGAIIWDDSMMAVINSSGLKCCEINDDGEIELSLYSERAVDAVSKYLAMAGDTDLCFPYQRYSGKGDIEKLSNDMFMGDRALFFVELLHRALSYRNMENDYGIIPFPKYDESQDAYYTNVGAYPSVFLAIPADVSDPEMIGTVLENLGYQSKEIVRDAYYTRTLVGKATRDDESAEMLDIIFSNRVYDIGWLEEVGGYNEKIMDIFRTGKSDFSSMYAKFETKAQDQIAKLNDEISGASEK